MAAWTAATLAPGSAGGDRLAVAVDGKTIRGARSLVTRMTSAPVTGDCHAETCGSRRVRVPPAPHPGEDPDEVAYAMYPPCFQNDSLRDIEGPSHALLTIIRAQFGQPMTRHLDQTAP